MGGGDPSILPQCGHGVGFRKFLNQGEPLACLDWYSLVQGLGDQLSVSPIYIDDWYSLVQGLGDQLSVSPIDDWYSLVQGLGPW